MPNRPVSFAVFCSRGIVQGGEVLRARPGDEKPTHCSAGQFASLTTPHTPEEFGLCISIDPRTPPAPELDCSPSMEAPPDLKRSALPVTRLACNPRATPRTRHWCNRRRKNLPSASQSRCAPNQRAPRLFLYGPRKVAGTVPCAVRGIAERLDPISSPLQVSTHSASVTATEDCAYYFGQVQIGEREAKPHVAHSLSQPSDSSTSTSGC